MLYERMRLVNRPRGTSGKEAAAHRSECTHPLVLRSGAMSIAPRVPAPPNEPGTWVVLPLVGPGAHLHPDSRGHVMRYSAITLSIPILAVFACGTDHHSVARVDGSSGFAASEPGALAGSSSAGASTRASAGSGNSAAAATGGDAAASAGAPTGGDDHAGAGTSSPPTGGAPVGGAASGGTTASAGSVATGGARATGGATATGGAGTSTGGGAGGTGGAGTTGGVSGGQGGSGGAGTCPAELPLLGDPCSSEDLSCHYTGCTATRAYCSATAWCSSGQWEIGYTDCECLGTGGAAGAGGAPAGGSAGQGGATSDCEFTFTTPQTGSTTCHIASSSQNSCGEAARCICAQSSDVDICVDSWTVPRGGPTFSDYCFQSSSAPSYRSLADALQALAPAYQGTTTVSEGCAEIPATLAL
jgi:hypothetical protein